MKIVLLELENGKELEDIKRKCENYAQEQLFSLKMLHQSEMKVIEGELEKLKKLIEIKNGEISGLIQQSVEYKNSVQDNIDGLVEENNNLKEKIYENNLQKEVLFNDLQDKLANLHIVDINQLKILHENQIRIYIQEKEHLEGLIQEKNKEIEQ